jgi:Domain of unknown function (DUF4262)
MGELPRPEDDADIKTLSDIASHGWHVIKIPEENGTPGWAFSMGLYHSFGHPEVAIFGLPLDRMHTMINLIGELVASGQRLNGGSTSRDILDGYDCAFREVARQWHRPFFGYACWLYRGDDFPVVQCFWPDRDGRAPDDPQCNAAVRGLQPRLHLETVEAAGVRDFLLSMQRDA